MSTTTDLDTIRETFTLFDSWEDKYRFVIDLGRDLPQFADADKTDDKLVRGCQSQVWLSHEYNPDTNQLRLAIDSDAHIVRGLIAIVLAAYDSHTPEEVVSYDIEGLFDELALLTHLSPTRGNGLRSMVARIQSTAEAYANTVADG